MNKAQRERFQRGGWKVGTVGEFLELTPAEEDLIETKLRLGGLVRALRERSHLSQAALAKRIGSSQPRVAKIESHDPEVSLDLQMRADLCFPTIGLPRARGSYQEVGGPHFGKKSCAHATCAEGASSTPRAQYQNRRLTPQLLALCGGVDTSTPLDDLDTRHSGIVGYADNFCAIWATCRP